MGSFNQFPRMDLHQDMLNLQDEKPLVMFGPDVVKKSEFVPPFYVTLNIHNFKSHNCTLDSTSSHTLMPKIVMEELGLQITKPYHDLYSFDSRRVKWISLIKDLLVSHSQIPPKILVTGIVVVDILVKFSMLLSKSWGMKLGGTLQLDMSYPIVLVFFGELRKLYRELKYS